MGLCPSPFYDKEFLAYLPATYRFVQDKATEKICVSINLTITNHSYNRHFVIDKYSNISIYHSNRLREIKTLRSTGG